MRGVLRICCCCCSITLIIFHQWHWNNMVALAWWLGNKPKESFILHPLIFSFSFSDKFTFYHFAWTSWIHFKAFVLQILKLFIRLYRIGDEFKNNCINPHTDIILVYGDIKISSLLAILMTSNYWVLVFIVLNMSLIGYMVWAMSS